MYIYKWLKYKYQKKHRYLDAYIQDLITEQSDQVLKPYKIELLTAQKTNKKINEFNYFTYKYEGIKYELSNGKTKTIN